MFVWRTPARAGARSRTRPQLGVDYPGDAELQQGMQKWAMTAQTTCQQIMQGDTDGFAQVTDRAMTGRARIYKYISIYIYIYQ